MNCIISISLFAKLLDKNLPQMGKDISVTLHYPDLYKGAPLGAETKKRLNHPKTKECLFEIPFSEKEMLHYHHQFARCPQRRCMTFEEFVAVEYAKDECLVLIAEEGWLNRYARSRDVKVMSLEELEGYCRRRQRLDRLRTERLNSFFADKEADNEKEPLKKNRR